jgi:hypothetical protein
VGAAVPSDKKVGGGQSDTVGAATVLSDEKVGGGRSETMGVAAVCGRWCHQTWHQVHIGDFPQWALGQTDLGRFNRVGQYCSNGPDPFTLFL